MATADDGDLLKRLLSGEQQAFRELVIAYQSAMRAVAYAIVGSRHADEVVQDAWLSVVRNLAGFYEAGDLVGIQDFKHLKRALDQFVARPAVQRGLLIPAAP